ncbi:MAG: peptidoglycan D,D-transpeptidase FtsI family protein [Pirellulales bacterium]
MARPDRYFDWHQVFLGDQSAPAVVDSRRRSRIALGVFAVLATGVLLRAATTEWTQGDVYRDLAARPAERELPLAAARGRILARDGTVLAHDVEVLALAVHYRWLEEPPQAAWLRSQARGRLPSDQRRNPDLLTAEEAHVKAERTDLHRRLALSCGLTPAEWNARARRIQDRVADISTRVNQARLASYERQRQLRQAAAEAPSESALDSVLRTAVEWLAAPDDEAPPERITVAEELEYHTLAEDVPPEAAAAIKTHPDQFPGVRIEARTRRAYPAGSLAAHTLGHLGNGVGLAGIERQCEAALRGRPGVAIERLDRRGRAVSSREDRAPAAGQDVALTLDPALQKTAESLLDEALARRLQGAKPAANADGGAIVVLDVTTGEILAAASAPRFEPGWFSLGQNEALGRVLKDPSHPLFDRVVQMAIPPGSVFKMVSAAALIENSVVDPEAPFHCQGYLHQPDRQRCALFRRRGVGHGEVTLADALAQSCNVYFFHFVEQLGAGPLTDWAGRFGFGRRTGIDLPGEAAGALSTPADPERLKNRKKPNGDAPNLAIGQGRLTATPLQVVVMMAAVANGGRLVTPHVVGRVGSAGRADASFSYAPPRPISELHPSTLEVIRRGLERGVADPSGTAHGTVHLESVSIAGKTGTAETGGGQADHAWFAGYVPAQKPKVAVVVALEHAGDGSEAAGPVVKRLVRRMEQLGYFGLGSQGEPEKDAAQSVKTPGLAAGKNRPDPL